MEVSRGHLAARSPFLWHRAARTAPQSWLATTKPWERSGLWTQFPHRLLPCPGFCVLESSTYNHLWEYCTDNRNPTGVGKGREGEKEKRGRGKAGLPGISRHRKRALAFSYLFFMFFNFSFPKGESSLTSWELQV